jgi:hypothetical protein
MSAKSILSSGNTSFLNELYNGTGSLALDSLSIGDTTGIAPVVLTNPDPGVLAVSGAVAPSDIQDNSGSIGTPGQVLVKANDGTDMLWSSDINIPGALTTGTTITVAGGSIELQSVGGNTLITNLGAGSIQIGGTLTTTGNVNCQDGELQGGTAQIGFNSVPGDIVLQVGNPSGIFANFSIGAGAGNPLTITRGITAGNTITASAGDIVISAGNLNCQDGELQGGTAQIGFNSVPGDIVLQVGNTSGIYANFSIGVGAGNPLTINRIIQPAGLVDANGLTGTAGQYPVANGAGGFVWTTP